jgi:hypothetical protein
VSVALYPEIRATPTSERVSFKRTKYRGLLIALFFLTLPLINPWVRGDGVGYYAFVRSMFIEHNLDFRRDWLRANPSFRMGRIDAAGNLAPQDYTVTGHINNHFSVGPAILWSPFVLVTHAGVLTYDHFGGHIPADGYSQPYVTAVALATAFYGFMALLISFALARRYVAESCAFLGTVGIWLASSLPVYMYFNPSWSHADSAFSVALFVWYWSRTRGRAAGEGRTSRTPLQWIALGAVGGLMINVYYLNAALLLFPLLESLAPRPARFAERATNPTRLSLLKATLFAAALSVTLLPTFITKKIIYGSYWNLGYTEHWSWNSPAFFKACFSADHGLFTWTPILILAVVGLFALDKYDRQFASYSIVVFLAYLYIIGCYQDWHGISSYGNRFFVALTPLFVLGLAALFDRIGHALPPTRAAIFAWGATGLLVLWNFGLIFQWGMHLIPERGPISGRVAVHNQLSVVPTEAVGATKAYFMHRKNLMDRIEQRDVIQIQSESGAPSGVTR